MLVLRLQEGMAEGMVMAASAVTTILTITMMTMTTTEMGEEALRLVEEEAVHVAEEAEEVEQLLLSLARLQPELLLPLEAQFLLPAADAEVTPGLLEMLEDRFPKPTKTMRIKVVFLQVGDITSAHAERRN